MAWRLKNRAAARSQARDQSQGTSLYPPFARIPPSLQSHPKRHLSCLLLVRCILRTWTCETPGLIALVWKGLLLGESIPAGQEVGSGTCADSALQLIVVDLLGVKR